MPSNIKVSVTADVLPLQAQMALARAETAGFGRELNALAKEARATGGNLDNELKGKLLQAADATARAKAQVTQLSQQMREAGGATHSFSGAMNQASSVAAAFGIAIPIASVAGIAAALGAATRAAFEWADTVTHASEKTGLSATAFQRFAYLAALSDTEVGSLTSGFEKLNNSLAKAREGSDEQAEAFRRLGLDISLPAEVLIPQLARALIDMHDPAERTRLSMILMGKSAAELIPFFKEVVENTNDITTVSDEALKAVTDFSDSMRGLGMEAKTAAAEGLGNALIKIEGLWNWANRGWQHTGLMTFLEGLANAIPGVRAAIALAGELGSAPAGGGLPFDTKALLDKMHGISGGQLGNVRTVPKSEMDRPSAGAGGGGPSFHSTARAAAQEYRSMLDEILEVTEQQTKKIIDDWNAVNESVVSGAEFAASEQIKDLNLLAQYHEISGDQEVAKEREIEQRRFQAVQAAINREIIADKDRIKRSEDNERQHQQRLNEINRQALAKRMAMFHEGWGVMAGGFNQAITSMIFHGESFQEAMLQLALSVGEGFTNMALKAAEDWIEGQIMSLLFEKPAALAKITARQTRT